MCGKKYSSRVFQNTIYRYIFFSKTPSQTCFHVHWLVKDTTDDSKIHLNPLIRYFLYGYYKYIHTHMNVKRQQKLGTML